MKKKRRAKLKTPPETLKLLEKIKLQLTEIAKPKLEKPKVWRVVKRFKLATRDKRGQVFPTVEDYKKMDPFWLSTMGGRFAGRVIRSCEAAGGSAAGSEK